jgi:hypothetical protein
MHSPDQSATYAQLAREFTELRNGVDAHELAAHPQLAERLDQTLAAIQELFAIEDDEFFFDIVTEDALSVPAQEARNIRQSIRDIGHQLAA